MVAVSTAIAFPHNFVPLLLDTQTVVFLLAQAAGALNVLLTAPDVWMTDHAT